MFALYLMAGMSFYVQVEKVAVNTYGENYKHAKPTMPATSRAAAQHGQERQAKQQLTGMLTKAYQRQH